MIVKEEFLSKLRRHFDLNLYEVKIWTALLSRGVSTAGELSDISDVPRSRSYDVLESLEKKGFVINKLGKPIKYIAVPPNEVVERVKKDIKKSAKSKMDRLEDLKEGDVVDELNQLHSQGVELVDPSELSGGIRGRHNLYNHIELTVRGAEDSVYIMATEDDLIRIVDSLRPTIEKLVGRGVDIKFAAKLDERVEKVLDDLNDLVEIKHVEDIRGRFILVDKQEIIFMVLDDKEVHPSYDVGIWVNTPFFSQSLAQLYEIAWDEFTPAEEHLKMLKNKKDNEA